ncbi:hypothetical protein R9C00_20370 [Flammeovirgaceae bacterium SG7u.111]|nr:hypothetical protein [Flammeovirgaceae bacterium SG7u.132]WPO34058.1 hypothetical protein R9C00_20370 [Flammeovirgaceae bacterium SG7u.111]
MKITSTKVNSIAVIINTIAILATTFSTNSSTEYVLLFLIIISIIINIVLIFKRLITSKIIKLINKQEIKAIPSPPENEYNNHFYDRFFNEISNSKRNIYIVGRGLACVDKKEKEIADRFYDNLNQSLKKGVTVVRIQATKDISEYWAEKMAQLISYYPNFKFYVLLDEGKHITSTCVFDPDNSKKNAVKISIPIFKSFGLNKNTIAGPSVFIYRNLKLSADIKEQIVKLADEKMSLFIDRSKFKTTDDNLETAKKIYKYLVSLKSKHDPNSNGIIRVLEEKTLSWKIINGTDAIYKVVEQEFNHRTNFNDILKIDILGYTLFSVVTQIEGWLDQDFLNNVEMNLFYIDPSFAEKSSSINSSWKKSIDTNIDIINGFKEENQKILNTKNVNINLYSYTKTPGVHGFCFNDTKYFFSFASWDEKGQIKYPRTDKFFLLNEEDGSSSGKILKDLFKNWKEYNYSKPV